MKPDMKPETAEKRDTVSKKELDWFDKPGNVKKVLVVFYCSLVLLLVSEFFIHKHAEFPWEGQFGFFASYGFVSCVALIFIARFLRLFIKRDENYYD